MTDNTYYLSAGLVLGAGAFAHCLGMCGAFPLHLAGGHGGRWANLARQALWHGGKTFTYVFLGALAGLAGDRAAALLSPAVWNVVSYVLGGFMVAMGLAVLGLLPWRGVVGGPEGGGLLAPLFGQVFRQPGMPAAFFLGLLTGFLPCPVVMLGLAMCVHSGSAVNSMATMAAMGTGTVWSLLILGVAGQFVRLHLRRWAPAVSGSLLVLLGAVTVLRGTEAFHHLLGCPQGQAQAAGTSATTQARPSCCSGMKHE